MKSTKPDPKRGEVWVVNLDPTKGAEIKKTRPVTVISTDAVRSLPLRTVVPLTTSDLKIAPWHIEVSASALNGLDRDSHADAVQVRTLACERFVRRLGRLSDETMDEIVAGVAMLIEYR
jgi:mRNA interferase MazF